MKNFFSKSASRRGFTLIELLIVIAIIGILATLSMFGLRTVQAKRRDVARVSNITELQKALSLYISQVGSYPVLTGCVTGADVVSTEIVAKGLLAGSSKLVDPVYPSDAAKCYYYVSAGSKYTLRYTLESNSSAGTAGDHIVVP
ncbi:MAG: type II secretion system protein [Patescibacteria group bacterium]